MKQIAAFPSVTEELLEEVVRRIVSVGSPRKIVLFGSWARGQAGPDSDLDLLIIEDSALPRHRRAGRHRMVLLGLFPAKDIVVWTPGEVRQWQHVPNTFITRILAEGRILYERSDRPSAWLATQGP
ncbi:MAG: nucleotidyltransferase domain-containing protein [Gammaproteobacteria bacterium]